MIRLLPLALMLLVGCGPQFLRNAHNYDPQDKTRNHAYWSCESPEAYAWGDCNWSTGYYKEIDGVMRLVGVRWCVGSALDAGYAYNAVCEDRDRYGPLATLQLGPQPHMHCRLVRPTIAITSVPPIDDHVRLRSGEYVRIKGATYFHDDNASLTFIGEDDNTTETRGHEVSHAHWRGDWHGEAWMVFTPIGQVGVQPVPAVPSTVHRWIPPDPPPSYNDHWHINRGDTPGVLLEELTQ
jgi:hypothetical protein